jgi:hypothetical protein
MKKKNKVNPTAVPSKEEQPSPLEKLAQDFKGMDEQESICQKKNDGTD